MTCIAPLVASHFYDALQEFSLLAQYLMRGITDQVQFQLLFEDRTRKGFGFKNRCRKTVNKSWLMTLCHNKDDKHYTLLFYPSLELALQEQGNSKVSEVSAYNEN